MKPNFKSFIKRIGFQMMNMYHFFAFVIWFERLLVLSKISFRVVYYIPNILFLSNLRFMYHQIIILNSDLLFPILIIKQIVVVRSNSEFLISFINHDILEFNQYKRGLFIMMVDFLALRVIFLQTCYISSTLVLKSLSILNLKLV